MISAYLKLVGDNAGEIKGPVRDRDPNKNNSIALLTLDHNIVSPRDAGTGLPRGKRQHLPITFTKETDNTSPLFYGFITRNELIKTADIFFFGVGSPTGFSASRETLLYRISLKKAWVAEIRFVGITDETAEENARFALTEKISLVYDSIVWEWTSPKMAAEDTFVAPQS